MQTKVTTRTSITITPAVLREAMVKVVFKTKVQATPQVEEAAVETTTIKTIATLKPSSADFFPPVSFFYVSIL